MKVGIAGIFKVRADIFRAQVLLTGTLTPVDLLYEGSYDNVRNRLMEIFPNVEVVREQEFRCELDYIHLFGACMSTDNNEYRLTDQELEQTANDVEVLHNWIDEQLDGLDREYRKLLPVDRPS